MNPRTKGRVWRWTTMAGIGLAGGVVIEFVLRGPWHEQTLWWFIAAMLGREIGDTAEAIEAGRQHRAANARQRAADLLIVERLEARQREREQDESS